MIVALIPSAWSLSSELVGDIYIHDELERALAVGDGALIECLIDGLEQCGEIVGAAPSPRRFFVKEKASCCSSASVTGPGPPRRLRAAGRAAWRWSGRNSRTAIGAPAGLHFRLDRLGFARRDRRLRG